jgi:hypothetical protein
VFASRVFSPLFFSTDLQPVPISDHWLSIADELSHQHNALIYTSNSAEHKVRATIAMENISSLSTMGDYERRFQRSLQKLTVPLWYTDVAPSAPMPNCDSKQSIVSTTSIPWKAHYRETQRTPEIILLPHPYNYRSCRSSLATSPSPSVHSWHPHCMVEGTNLSLLRPSVSRRHQKYEKGIDRVSKSSRWYRPAQLADSHTGRYEGIFCRGAQPVHCLQSIVIAYGEKREGLDVYLMLFFLYNCTRAV